MTITTLDKTDEELERLLNERAQTVQIFIMNAEYAQKEADAFVELYGAAFNDHREIRMELEYRRNTKLEPPSPWRTGEPEYAGTYLVDTGEENGVDRFLTNYFDPDGWGWVGDSGIIRWMEIPGEKYGGAE